MSMCVTVLGRSLLEILIIHLSSVVDGHVNFTTNVGRNAKHYVTSYLVAKVMEVSDNDFI